MRIEDYLLELKKLLESKGWVYLNDEDKYFMKLQNTFIFSEKKEILIPKYIQTPDFSSQLLLSLNCIIQVEPVLSKHKTILTLISKAKNIKHKFSKVKNEWILREPNSKYNQIDIPDIYIPKN